MARAAYDLPRYGSGQREAGGQPGGHRDPLIASADVEPQPQLVPGSQRRVHGADRDVVLPPREEAVPGVVGERSERDPRARHSARGAVVEIDVCRAATVAIAREMQRHRAVEHERARERPAPGLRLLRFALVLAVAGLDRQALLEVAVVVGHEQQGGRRRCGAHVPELARRPARREVEERGREGRRRHGDRGDGGRAQRRDGARDAVGEGIAAREAGRRRVRERAVRRERE